MAKWIGHHSRVNLDIMGHRQVSVHTMHFLRTLLLPLLVSLILTGCISNYTYFHDERNVPVPPQTEMCLYRWEIDEPIYRYEGLSTTEWGSSNVQDTVQPIHQQVSACAEISSQPKRWARAIPYYLKYVDKIDRSLFILPNTAAYALSMGVIPLSLTDYYAVCIKIVDENGKQRSALASGHLLVSENMWERVFPNEFTAARRRLKKEAVLWRDLTQQAWQILWLSGHPSNKLVGECRDILDRMVY